MEQVFVNVLNNAITVSALIVAIIIVRAFGKKMPKWIVCMLWVIVAVKLVVPIKIESVLSLIPTGEPIPANIITESRHINSGISSVVGNVNSVDSPNIAQSSMTSTNPVQTFFHIGGAVWLAGMIAMLIYAVVTYLMVRRRVSVSYKVNSKVYVCDDISDSFILGIISPRVYLPSSLPKEAREYILKHEFAHLSRCDHIWKPLGFALLSVYWFNPLCWVAYILLCKDIEYACDEKVTKNIGKRKKAEYCRILLENSMPRKMIAACPVAFGETDVKNRIRNVANYKRPAFWISVSSILVCIAVGVCFATSRGSENVHAQQAPEVEQVQEGQKETDGLVNLAEEGEENEKGDLVNTVNDIIAYSEGLTENADNLDDSQFVFGGKVISVMDSFEDIDKAIREGYDNNPDCFSDFGEGNEWFYDYFGKEELGKGYQSDFSMGTYKYNGTILPIFLNENNGLITTSRNIKVGSTKDEVIAAYGNPNVEQAKGYGPDGKELTGDDYIEVFGDPLTYDMGDYQIDFLIKDGKVSTISYQNNINYDKCFRSK
ncbi:MAG: hypothetical protein J5802_10455 [Butyrivibrio sp.]|nr:hypothetical protein [Butyrivibrio sp.]